MRLVGEARLEAVPIAAVGRCEMMDCWKYEGGMNRCRVEEWHGPVSVQDGIVFKGMATYSTQSLQLQALSTRTQIADPVQATMFVA